MFYGWAEKNTRPKIKSNEKRKRHKVNGLLSVDAISGEEYSLSQICEIQNFLNSELRTQGRPRGIFDPQGNAALHELRTPNLS